MKIKKNLLIQKKSKMNLLYSFSLACIVNILLVKYIGTHSEDISLLLEYLLNFEAMMNYYKIN